MTEFRPIFESQNQPLVVKLERRDRSDVTSVNGKTGVVVLNASDVHALPDSTSIPVVDSDLSGTSTNAIQNKVVKNALDGKYTKPQTGIPSTDMSEAVQTSLGKADSALQESDIHSSLIKILDVTLTEEATLTVTEVDGQPLSVEELHLEVIASGDVVAGNARAYCGTQKVGESYHGAQTGLSNRHWFASWKKVGGSWVSECCDTFATNQFATVKRYFVSESDGAFAAVSVLDYPKIDKLMLPKFPAGAQIILYAR